MKKSVVLILALLYIGVASGVMVNVHYCMGNLASVDYGTEEKETCGKCGMKEKKGCCHTEYKLVKIEDAHQLAKINVDFFQVPAEAPVYVSETAFVSKELEQLQLQYHSPPDPRVNEVYLHNSVFRI